MIGKLSKGTKLTVRWSQLGSPTTPGIYEVPALGGKVEISPQNLYDVSQRGGDPQLSIENCPSATDTQNFWTIATIIDDGWSY